MQKKTFNFSRKLLDTAANELRQLLDVHKPIKERRELEEKEHLQTFFNNHPIVLCTLAHLVEMSELDVDEMQFEFDLWGNFRCDIGFGNSTTNTYCLIELEDAKKDSIFAKKPVRHPKFSDRINRGQSQIEDWIWKIDSLKNNSNEIKELFDSDHPTITYLLIIGRNHFIERHSLKERFKFKKEMHSKIMKYLTYDEVLLYLENSIKKIDDYKKME